MSFFRKTILISAMALCAAVTVFAQDETVETTSETVKDKDVIVLTVDEAVDYMLQNSRTLKAAEIDLALAKFKKNTAWNVFVPSVTVSGTMSRANKWTNSTAAYVPIYQALGGLTGNSALISAADAMNLKETESAHWTAVGNLGLSWNLSAAYVQQMRATMEGYETGKLTWEDTVKQNELNVRKLFYGILLSQENVKLQQRSLENARQRMNQASVNFRNGYTSQLNLLQTQVSYENLRPTVEKAEEGLKDNIDMLAFLIGYPTGTKIELSGSLDRDFIKLNEEELFEKIDDSNPSIQQLKQGIKTMKLQKSASDLGAYTPALAISWSTQPTSISGKGAFDMDWSNDNNWRDTGSLSFTLAWNLTNMLPFSSNRVQARELEDSIKKYELNLETLRQKTYLEVQTAINTFNQARKAIDSSERQIDLARRSYEMTLQAYRNGTTELLNVNEAETQLIQAELGLANEQYNYISAIMDLEYKLNIKLSE